MAKTTPEFDIALETFLTRCREIVEANDGKLVPQPGRRYIRIVKRQHGQEHGSAWAFIDTTNGDVLKPASYKAPAKHARGNIFNNDNGLGCMGKYGVAYLR